MADKRKRWLTLLKVVVSLGLLGYIVSSAIARDGVDVLATRLGELDMRWLGAAVALQLAAMFGGILRWQLLLRARDVVIPFGWVVRSYFVGRFAAAFTPSTAGLDLYRIYDVTRATGETAKATAAIVIEKATGLLGLAIVCFALAPLGGRALLGDAAYVASIGASVGALAGLYLFLVPRHLRRVAELAPKKVRVKVLSLVDALTAGRLGAGTLIGALALGLSVHLAISAVFCATALSLHLEVPVSQTLIVGTAIVVAVLLPISIAGVGVREGVAVVLLGRVGVSVGDATLVALLGYFAGQVPAVIGGLWSLRAPKIEARTSSGVV